MGGPPPRITTWQFQRTGHSATSTRTPALFVRALSDVPLYPPRGDGGREGRLDDGLQGPVRLVSDSRRARLSSFPTSSRLHQGRSRCALDRA